jgi:hypothetical protein
MAFQLLRGLLASKPTLAEGQQYVATDTKTVHVGLGSSEILLKDSSEVALVSESSVLDAADKFVFCDATSAPMTITLPACSESLKGQTYFIKKVDGSTNAVTITPVGSDTIDGLATALLTTKNQGSIVVCSGSSWFLF